MEPVRQSYVTPRVILEGYIEASAGSEVPNDPFHVELMDPLEAEALGLDSPLNSSD